MARSFDLVDFKVAEAEFFLRRIPECGPDFFAVRCYVSAFMSSTRSITYAVQACLKNIGEFSGWYKVRQEHLKNDDLSKFFNEFRNINVHIGENVVQGGSMTAGKCIYWFRPVADLRSVPEQDVESACREYFVTILSIVYDCYIDFGPHIDPKQHYTADNFARMGKTVEDAEEETLTSHALSAAMTFESLLGIKQEKDVDVEKLRMKVRGWTYVPGYPEDYRWQALRDSQPGCRINHIFQEYLDKTTPEPERLPDLPSPEGEGWYQTESGGRVWIPPDSRISDDPGECLDHFLKTVAAKKNEDQ